MIRFDNPWGNPVESSAAVIGSRGFPNRSRMVARFFPSNDGRTAIVTGTVPDFGKPSDRWGVDEWAVIHGLAAGMTVIVHEIQPGTWTFGQRAAARNHLIADEAERVVAFWDGKSRGTKMTLGFFRALGKPWQVVYPDGTMKRSANWWDAIERRAR